MGNHCANEDTNVGLNVPAAKSVTIPEAFKAWYGKGYDPRKFALRQEAGEAICAGHAVVQAILAGDITMADKKKITRVNKCFKPEGIILRRVGALPSWHTLCWFKWDKS